MSHNVKDSAISGLKHLILIIFALAALLPFVWIVLSSFKNNTSIFTKPFELPTTIRLENYVSAWKKGKIGTFFMNSVIVTFGTVILQLLVSAMATYILTRVSKIPALASYFLLGLMIPIQAMLIPDFLIIRGLNLMNSRIGVVIIYCATGISFAIFLLSGFMKDIPWEIQEAAMIDGAGYSKIFFSIILPISKPALATVATFSFLSAWNEFLFATVLLTKQTTMTITLGINYLKGQYTTDYGLLCAGLVIAIVPVVIMYVLLQEQVIKGMTTGAVKG